MKIAAWFSYNGAPFSGFARQHEQLTVQGDIEEALELLFRRPIETTCAGRTDAGVHALCQVISFDLLDDEWSRQKPESLLRSLNALMHDAISFRTVRPMPEDFSARFSAVSREYRYYICTDAAKPLLMENFCWHLGKSLDIEQMTQASQYLIGEHDFKSFCMAVSAKGKPTHRYVAEVSFEREQIWNSNLVVITVVGNAFLHSMVRTMVGTLVLVGLGKRSPEWMKSVLDARNRQAAGQNAPAQGLVLWKVNYKDQDYFYDPRPSQLLGELASERSLLEAIEDIPTIDLPEVLHEGADVKASKKTDRTDKANKAEKANKADKANRADRVDKADKAPNGETKHVSGTVMSRRMKRKQEKEKAREFIIPRGPNLEASDTGELSAVSSLKQGADQEIRQDVVQEGAQDRVRNADRVEQEKNPIAHQSTVGQQKAQSPISSIPQISIPSLEVPSNSNVSSSMNAPSGPRSSEVESDPLQPAVVGSTRSTTKGSHEFDTERIPKATVLSAAGARQRRREREAQRSGRAFVQEDDIN